MNDTILVGVELDGHIIDLKIPTQVTVRRLKSLLQEAFVLLGIQLPDEMEFILKNKPFKLLPDVLLADYPIGDGDQFLIIHQKNSHE